MRHPRMMPLMRAGVVAAALAMAGAVATRPAEAFLGGLIGGDGDGCGGAGGLIDGLGGLVGIGGEGGAGAGCPIVESAPFQVEEMIQDQKLELVLQTAHMVEQIDNMIKMRRRSGLDTAAEVASAIRDTLRVAGRVERVLWRVAAVDADFEALYPDVLARDMTAEALAAHQAEQARLARAASRASKLVTADALTGLAAYPRRTARLAAAMEACEGQTCATDVSMQATLLAAEIAGRLLTVQAAHHRAVEARLDYDRAAIERARQHAVINWRGFDRYGGSGVGQ